MIEKCPVCEGKGILPPDFYQLSNVVSANLDPITCRSCDGKGYIIISSNHYDEERITNLNDTRYCGSCKETDGLCYSSNPPKVKCMLSGKFRNYDDTCEYSNIKLSNMPIPGYTALVIGRVDDVSALSEMIDDISNRYDSDELVLIKVGPFNAGNIYDVYSIDIQNRRWQRIGDTRMIDI